MKLGYYAVLLVIFILGFFIGVVTPGISETQQMESYDLYNCIYNNAGSNGFTNNPYLVEKIQDECICFRENNYTNVMEKC